MDKIENMEIDYSAAMEKRADLHEKVRQELDAKQNKAKQKAASPVALAPTGTRPVLMAIASKGGGLVNQHFGHAREFLVYEASPAGVRFIGHRKTELYCAGGDTCGEAESSLSQIIRALVGCEVVLCSKVGHEPWEILEAAGIQPNGEHGAEPIEEAVAAVYGEMWRTGKLAEPAESATLAG
jgi:nitrogen fixation protein NifB